MSKANCAAIQPSWDSRVLEHTIKAISHPKADALCSKRLRRSDVGLFLTTMRSVLTAEDVDKLEKEQIILAAEITELEQAIVTDSK